MGQFEDLDFEGKLHYRYTARPMKIKDGLEVNREREAIAERHKGDDSMMLTLYNLPMLKHSSTLEMSSDGQNWQTVEINEDIYLNLPELMVADWLVEIYGCNPQHGVTELARLKNVLSGLTSKSDDTPNSKTAENED
jgi:hypothetical protein